MKKAVIFLTLLLLPLHFFTSCRGAPRVNYRIIVNKEHPVSEVYIVSVCFVDMIDDVEHKVICVEQKTYEAFQALKAALEEKGIKIGISSGYRSMEKQKQLMDEYIDLYGYQYAHEVVASPGASEHHTGLAVDIVPMVDGEWVVENEDMLKETDLFAVIHETLPDYGFILRYPEGKEEITGYSYEPWHIRYVGEEFAKELYEKGLTMEEWALLQ